MNVIELRDKLNQLIDSGHGMNDVMIDLPDSDKNEYSMTTPIAKIKGAYAGIDWDHGKVYLQKEETKERRHYA